MNYDAQEAALGLLGLSPSNLSAPTIPAKRKQTSSDEDMSTEAIRCICGFTFDDGFSIACDDCSRWCHAACFDIVEGEVPEEWRCWICVPRPVDRDRAAKLQRARIKLAEENHKFRRKSSPGADRKHRRQSAAAIEGGGGKRKRRLSMAVAVEDEHVDIDEPWTDSYVHIPHDLVPQEDTRAKLRRHAQHWRGVTALTPPSPYTPVLLDNLDKPPPMAVKPLSPSSVLHPSLSLFTNPHVRPPTYAVHTTTPVSSEHLIAPYTSSITPSATYLADPLNAYAHLGMPKPFVHLVGPPLDLALDSRIIGNHSRFVRSGCRPNAVLRPTLCGSSSQTLTFGVFALRDLKVNEEVILGWEWDDGNAIHSLPALIESPHMFPEYLSHSPDQVTHLRNQMANILHALSSTFTTCACGARAKDCALNQMAAFVDGEPMQEDNVDLGPLVGKSRGFRTRERVPFSGGMSGFEMCEDDVPPVPSFALSPASPSPSKGRARDKGKGRAIMGYEEDEDDVRGRSTIFDLKSQTNKHKSPLRVITMNTESRHLVPAHDLRPPDPPEPDDHTEPVNEPEEKMPPKMRKRWIHRESEALKELNGRSSESPAGSSVSLGSAVSGAAGGSPGQSVAGLAIRLSEDQRRYGSQSLLGDSDKVFSPTSDMPPPRIPASLDPTTVSSVKSLPKPSPSSPHGPSSSASPQESVVSTSPSASFAQLSLFSPSNLSYESPTQILHQPSPQLSWSAFRRVTDGEGYFVDRLHHKQDPPLNMSDDVGGGPIPNLESGPNDMQNFGRDLGEHCSLPADPPLLDPRQPSHASPPPSSPLVHVSLPTSSERDQPPPEHVSPILNCGIASPWEQPTMDKSNPGYMAVDEPPARDPSGGDIMMRDETAQNDEPTRSTSDAGPRELQAVRDVPQTTQMNVDSDSILEISAEPSYTCHAIAPPSPAAPCPRDHVQSRASPPSDRSPNSTSILPIQTASSPSPSPIPQSLLTQPYSPPQHSPPPHTSSLSRPTSPPPPPKVKMSLRDFALRKKKLREVEMSRDSPASTSTTLPTDVDSVLTGSNEGDDSDVANVERINGVDSGHHNEVGKPEDTLVDDAKVHLTREGHEYGDALEEKRLTDEEGSVHDRAPIRPSQDINPPVAATLPLPDSASAQKVESKASLELFQTQGELQDLSESYIQPRAPFHPASSVPPLDTEVRLTKVELIEHALPDDAPLPLANHPLHPDIPGITRKINGDYLSDRILAAKVLASSPVYTTPALSSGSLGSKALPMQTDFRYVPRSHSPPTQPRSFQAAALSPPPSLPTTRPNFPSQLGSTTPSALNTRPLPIGPRALRNAIGLVQPPPTRPTPNSYIPRGPSADRDRQEWDRGDIRFSYRGRARGGPSWGR